MEFSEEQITISWSRIATIVGIIFVILSLCFGGIFLYAKKSEGKVFPGIYIGDISVAGMEYTELEQFLQKMSDKMISEGITFVVDEDERKDSFVIHPIITGSEEAIELFNINISEESDRIFNYGKTGDVFSRILFFVGQKFGKEMVLSLEYVDIKKDKLQETLEEKVSIYENDPVDAGIDVESVNPLVYHIVSSTSGYTFEYEYVLNTIAQSWKNLQVPSIVLNTTEQQPQIFDEDILPLIDKVEQIFESGDLVLLYSDSQTTKNKQWKLNTTLFADWIELQRIEGNGFGFGLNKEKVEQYLQDIVLDSVNVQPRDAKFSVNISDTRVTEFQTSRPGIQLVVEKTYSDINDAFLQRSFHDEGIAKTLQITVETAEPNIKTGEVNNFGIKEILGVGISDFSGSPRNRILNIKNGATLLDGLLLKPGEEFSSIKFTEPYTLENGYLPELVIKGDEIKPEIGGGLCQIGTTLFRMAMNGGLEITERRNHSLSVFYYNDPVNHLPGTDATIYDPAPDFKFRNDTEHYILIDTDVDYDNMQLVFTIWGTSDGREGSYTHPVVHKWYQPGETITKESTSLEPGEKNCQHKYVGADASFTYTRTFSGLEPEETIFESHYRPLPEICLVGIEEVVEEEEVNF
jgi:vancomycin resistance protein YoaR